jgi:uncharacterized protein (TIGR02453 family)
MTSAYFTPALFKFLSDLAANNDRDWFNANKDRYIETVQEPALDFITDFGPRLKRISPHFTADSRVQGGSLFRIYRDTRFGADKTPYKTNTGMQFRHERAKDAHAPGFYLHLQPRECFMGVGLWRPRASVANEIRQHIDEKPVAWKRAAHGKKFKGVFTLEGDSLKRPPSGFDAEHALIEDLKRKDFIASVRLTQKEVTSAGFMDLFDSRCRTAGPYMKFLCEALRLPY